MSGSLNAVNWLLEVKPDIDISDNNEASFRSACEYGHLEVFIRLLEVKPYLDISAENEYAFREVCLYSKLEVSKSKLEVAKWLQSLFPEKYHLEIVDNKIVSYSVKINKTIKIQLNYI
jgi:hypothetical protein